MHEVTKHVPPPSIGYPLSYTMPPADGIEPLWWAVPTLGGGFASPSAALLSAWPAGSSLPSRRLPIARRAASFAAYDIHKRQLNSAACSSTKYRVPLPLCMAGDCWQLVGVVMATPGQSRRQMLLRCPSHRCWSPIDPLPGCQQLLGLPPCSASPQHLIRVTACCYRLSQQQVTWLANAMSHHPNSSCGQPACSSHLLPAAAITLSCLRDAGQGAADQAAAAGGPLPRLRLPALPLLWQVCILRPCGVVESPSAHVLPPLRCHGVKFTRVSMAADRPWGITAPTCACRSATITATSSQ
jgi:hypothetical protein